VSWPKVGAGILPWDNSAERWGDGKGGNDWEFGAEQNDPTVKFHEDVMGPTNHPFSKLKLLASHCSSARWLPDWLQSVDVQWRWERSGCILKHHELSEDVPKGNEGYHWHAYCFRKQIYISYHIHTCGELFMWSWFGYNYITATNKMGLFTDLLWFWPNYGKRDQENRGILHSNDSMFVFAMLTLPIFWSQEKWAAGCWVMFPYLEMLSTFVMAYVHLSGWLLVIFWV
jgi:hypothetical protein